MNTILSAPAESFLRAFAVALSPLPAAEREDLLREIRGHLLERGFDSDERLRAEFGAPELFAREFLREHTIKDALARPSSWRLVRALFAVGRDSFLVLAVLFPLCMLSLIGLAAVCAAVLKPFFPNEIFLVSINGREVLGAWSIPICIVGGALLFFGANRALRALLRWRLSLGSKSRRWAQSSVRVP